MAVLTKSFSFSGNVPIPDFSVAGITNTISVSGIPDTAIVTKITVTLSITHTFDQDLDIALADPDGNSIVLSDDNGVGLDNYTNTTFDDSAINSPVTAGAAPFTGIYKPEGSLASLIPGAVNGGWTLKIADDGPPDTGTLIGWTLNISYVVPDNLIIGTDSPEALTGGSADDHIIALAGDDMLAGKAGNDLLTGNAGRDSYIFDTALDGATNVDTITGFSPKNDLILLDDAIFAKLTPGGLKGKLFNTGNKAEDKNDYINYNAKTGDTSYDADGSKKAIAPIVFLHLDDGLKVKADDFSVI